MKKLVQKINYRLKRLLGQLISFRSHYRPVGIYNTSKEFYHVSRNTNVYYAELFPNLITRLKIPEPMFKALSSYKVYDAIDPDDACTLMVQTNYHIVRIPHGRIFTDNVTFVAVISEDNKLIKDISFQYIITHSGSLQANAVFAQKYFQKPKLYKGTVFTALTGGGGIHNYGHWLIDVLPCIYLLKESGLFDTVDWFLVPNYEHFFQKESLQLLGIDESKIISGQWVQHLQADAIIASTPPRGERSFLIPDWVTDLHRKYLLTEQVIDGKNYPDRIYISRKDSKMRSVINEDEVVHLLKTYGFEIVIVSKLSFKEQINLFYKSKIIVSASGAGLAGLVFANEQGKVLEIFSQGFVHTHYYNMAKSVGMEYNFLICTHPSPATNGKQGEHENITVDTDKLKLALSSSLHEIAHEEI